MAKYWWTYSQGDSQGGRIEQMPLWNFFFECLLFIIYMKLGKYIIPCKIMYEVYPRPKKWSRDAISCK
jgi:hypothetical protein